MNTEKELPMMRNSERQDFKSCPAKWNWRWNQGWKPAAARQDARWFGGLWHLLWAKVYTPPAGQDGFTRDITEPSEIHQLWDDLTKNAYTTVSSGKFFSEDDEKEFWDANLLGHIMIDGQLRQWNLDPGYEVLMPEQRFSQNIAFTQDQIEREIPEIFREWHNHPEGRSIVKMVGTFDMPIRDHTDGRGRFKILDWKTTNRKDNLKQLNKDDQTGTYIGISTQFLRNKGVLKPDEAVEGMIFSFARKAKPPENADENGVVRNKPTKTHFYEAFDQAGIAYGEKDTLATLQSVADAADLTVWGDPSKRQGSPLFWREVVQRNRANRLRQIRRIAEDAEVIAFTRAGDLPIIKSPGDHCNWCDFSDLCDIDEDGGDTEEFIKNVFKYEDPYADHRAGARNSKNYEGP